MYFPMASAKTRDFICYTSLEVFVFSLFDLPITAVIVSVFLSVFVSVFAVFVI